MPLLLSYLKDELRKTRFALTNPSLRANEVRYLKQMEACILICIARHPESRAERYNDREVAR